MAKNTYDMVMKGRSDNNIRFSDLKNLFLSYDFNKRIKEDRKIWIVGGMDMYKYSMFMLWSEEDQSYIVSVPELPGCMADGKTPEEAIKNTQVIIKEWIECALEDRALIPEPHLFNDVTV